MLSSSLLVIFLFIYIFDTFLHYCLYIMYALVTIHIYIVCREIFLLIIVIIIIYKPFYILLLLTFSCVLRAAFSVCVDNYSNELD